MLTTLTVYDTHMRLHRYHSLGIKSDLKAKQELHNYDRWYRTGLICERDRATRVVGHFCYANFALDAGWTMTIRSHEDMVAQTPRARLTPWLCVPGFRMERHMSIDDIFVYIQYYVSNTFVFKEYVLCIMFKHVKPCTIHT